MSEPPLEAAGPVDDPPGGHSAGRTILRAAALIAVLTVIARITGFGRILVFSRTVGNNCLADTYQSANTVPNILYEIVAGGALAGLVIPLLARSVAAGDRERTNRAASAALTWTVLVLTPIAVAVAVFAEPIATVLLGAKTCAGAVEIGASMLRVFAPQVVLYGVGIVLTGILQAHRRFGGPALAPLLSSLTVIGAYLFYASQTRRGTDVDTVSTAQELILSVGTTLGVVVLSMCLLVPLRGTGFRFRPAVRFPEGLGRRARSLALAGIASLAAQQVSVAVTLLLGNAAGVPDGTVVVFTYAQTLFLLPWAVLAVPVATSVFPRLADRWEAGDRESYRRDLASATRTIVVLSLLAIAALVAAAAPLARVVVEGASGRPSVRPLTDGIVAMAPGLVGYALFALLVRALYARGETVRTAIACVLGWLVVIVADVVLAGVLPAEDRVLALGLGNSIGMTVLGIALLVVVVRRVGPAAFDGLGRAALVGLFAAVIAGAAGWGISRLWSGGGVWAAVGQAAVVGLVVLVGFGGTMMVVARDVLIGSIGGVRGRRTTPASVEQTSKGES